jgi:hypothetical protein
VNHAALPLLVVLAGIAFGLARPRSPRGTLLPSIAIAVAAVAIQIVIELTT